jgi:hypothetical protein
MAKPRTAVVLLLSALLAPLDALAEQSAATPDVLDFRKWDAGGSLGLFITGNEDFGGNPYAQTDGAAAWNLDLGRYVTTHLKADVGVMLNGTRHVYGFPASPVSGLPPGYTYAAYAQTSVHPTSLSGAVTYQFFENAYVHPYLSTGVRTTWQAEHTVRYPQTFIVNGVTYRVPPLDERYTARLTRPFVAGGFKSYFNERTFMRSEVLIALGPHGFSHATLRIGAGVDF